jgi:hypothetical protein
MAMNSRMVHRFLKVAPPYFMWFVALCNKKYRAVCGKILIP